MESSSGVKTSTLKTLRSTSLLHEQMAHSGYVENVVEFEIVINTSIVALFSIEVVGVLFRIHAYWLHVA